MPPHAGGGRLAALSGCARRGAAWRVLVGRCGAAASARRLFSQPLGEAFIDLRPRRALAQAGHRLGLGKKRVPGCDFCRSSKLAGPAEPTPIFVNYLSRAKQLGRARTATRQRWRLRNVARTTRSCARAHQHRAIPSEHPFTPPPRAERNAAMGEDDKKAAAPSKFNISSGSQHVIVSKAGPLPGRPRSSAGRHGHRREATLTEKQGEAAGPPFGHQRNEQAIGRRKGGL